MAFPLTVMGKRGWEKVTSTKKLHRLGTRMENPDGRIFYYSQANGSIGSGHVIMQKNHANAKTIKDLVVTEIAALGATIIKIKATGGTILVNRYADGYCFVNDMGSDSSAGEGMVYRLKGNTVGSGVSNGSTMTLTLDEADGIQEEALATASQIGLRENPFFDVEDWDATDIDGMAVGVTPTDVADDEYFWAQTWGTAGCLTAGVVVLGNQVTPSNGAVANGASTIDGAIQALPVLKSHPATAAAKVNVHVAGSLTPVIGVVQTVGATTEYSLVFLTISR